MGSDSCGTTTRRSRLQRARSRLSGWLRTSTLATTVEEKLAPAIRFVPMGTITIYSVSEEELRLIETGGPSSTYLNLAIAFLSTGISVAASLLLADVRSMSDKTFVVLVTVAVASLIAGTTLLFIWRRVSKIARSTLAMIRARAPKADEQATSSVDARP